jgi:hypothetical protein
VTATLTFGSDAPVNLTSGAKVSVEKTPGYYDLVISLTDGDGKPAGAAEKVHIYSGLESEAIYEFTGADFKATGGGAGGSLSYNTWAEGNISSPGEVHWYTFTPAAAGTYYVIWDDNYNDSGNKTLAGSVSAYRAGGTPIFTDRASGYSVPEDVTVSANETITVRIEGQGNWTGTYALKYYDPATVAPPASPTNIRVRGNPAPACFVTWFSVHTATEYKVSRSTTTPEGPYTLLGTVLGQYGTSYSYNDTSNDIIAGTTYYYKVQAINTYGDGPESAPFSDTPPATTIGTLLTENTWTDGKLISSEGADWYRVTPQSSGTYYIQWDDSYEKAGKTLASYVSAYRTNGTQVFLHTNGWTFELPSFSISAGETIYVRVDGYRSNFTGTYAIRYYQQLIPDSPPPLALNTWTEGNFTVIGQVMWYTFPANANATYALQWDSLYDGTNAYNGWVDVWAFSSDGTQLAHDSNGYSSPLILSVSSNDTIYVKIQDKGYPGSGSYAIRYYEQN